MNLKIDISNCSDAELIEYALVAIGYDRVYTYKAEYNRFTDSYGRVFDPFSNAEQALLLQCMLRLSSSVGFEQYSISGCDHIVWANLSSGCEYRCGDNSWWIYTEFDYSSNDGNAAQNAIKRVITIVAAKIGKITIESKSK